MVDEREGDVAEEDLPYAFTRKSVWQRIAIAGAGPAVNFVLAVFLFWIIMAQGTTDRVPFVGDIEPGSIAQQARLEKGQEIIAIDGKPTPTARDVALRLMDRLGETGTIRFTVSYPDSPELQYQSDAQLNKWLQGVEEPDPLEGIGLSFLNPPVIMGEVVEGSPADLAGIETGDEVLMADGLAIDSWTDWVMFIRERPGQNIDVVVDRNGYERTLSVVPDTLVDEESGENIGRIGVAYQTPENFIRRYEYSLFEALGEGFSETKDASIFILISIKKLIFGEISTKNLSGPITIAKVAGSTADDGWVYFVQFLAWLSVSLGVLNLMPIPVLDGGHILYYLVEAIKGSPVSERIQVIGYQVGLFMVVGIMVLALYNDILRL